MGYIQAIVMVKGVMRRLLISGHITLYPTKETDLIDLRRITSSISRMGIGENGWYLANP